MKRMVAVTMQANANANANVGGCGARLCGG